MKGNLCHCCGSGGHCRDSAICILYIFGDLTKEAS